MISSALVAVGYRKQPLCVAAVCAALVALAGCGAKDPAKPDTRAIGRRLAEIAGQANGAAPANIDDNTRLDGAKAGPGLKLTTTYTLLNSETESVDNAKFEAKVAPVVKQGSCANRDLRQLIDLGVLVVLEYRGVNGNPIATVNINRATCAALK